MAKKKTRKWYLVHLQSNNHTCPTS